MVKWWIVDDQVVSRASESGKPGNFSEVEGIDLPIEEVAYDPKKKKVIRRPPEIVEPVPIMEVVEITNNWDVLLGLLAGSPEWDRSYRASKVTPGANTAFTCLLSTITSLRQVSQLVFFLLDLRGEIAQIKEIGDFSPQELLGLRSKLDGAKFDTNDPGLTMALNPDLTFQEIEAIQHQIATSTVTPDPV